MVQHCYLPTVCRVHNTNYYRHMDHTFPRFVVARYGLCVGHCKAPKPPLQAGCSALTVLTTGHPYNHHRTFSNVRVDKTFEGWSTADFYYGSEMLAECTKRARKLCGPMLISFLLQGLKRMRDKLSLGPNLPVKLSLGLNMEADNKAKYYRLHRCRF
jgi:hypothetical protein